MGGLWLVNPRCRLRDERRRRGWSQEQLADEMTKQREKRLGKGAERLPLFTYQHVARIEGGRRAFVFEDPAEPLWWMLLALGLTIAVLAED